MVDRISRTVCFFHSLSWYLQVIMAIKLYSLFTGIKTLNLLSIVPFCSMDSWKSGTDTLDIHVQWCVLISFVCSSCALFCSELKFIFRTSKHFCVKERLEKAILLVPAFAWFICQLVSGRQLFVPSMQVSL